MRRSVKSLAIIGLLSSAVAASAFTVPSGTVKLKWREYRPGDAVTHSGQGLEIKKVAKGQFIGLKSPSGYWGTIGRFIFVVDESKGAGKGYDMAYVFVDSPTPDHLDVKKATKVPLKQDECDAGELIEKAAVPVNLRFGGPQSKIIEKAALALHIQMEKNGKSKAYPYYATLNMLGAWYGKMESDNAGPLRIVVTDDNLNGLFNDPPTHGWGCDTVDVQSKRCWPGHTTIDSHRANTGKASLIDGKLYVVKVSPAGDSVEFEPYTGEVGTVRIEAKDAKGNPMGFENMSVCGENVSISFDEYPGNDFTVPPGDYQLNLEMIPPQPKVKEDSDDHLFSYYLNPMPVKVYKDQTTVATAGGPITMKLYHGYCCDQDYGKDIDENILQISTKDTYVGVDFRIGGLETCGGAFREGFEWKAQMTLKDQQGNIIKQAETGLTSPCFSLPANLKPGDYTFEVTLDSKGYQDPISIKKTLRVVD